MDDSRSYAIDDPEVSHFFLARSNNSISEPLEKYFQILDEARYAGVQIRLVHNLRGNSGKRGYYSVMDNTIYLDAWAPDQDEDVYFPEMRYVVTHELSHFFDEVETFLKAIPDTRMRVHAYVAWRKKVAKSSVSLRDYSLKREIHEDHADQFANVVLNAVGSHLIMKHVKRTTLKEDPRMWEGAYIELRKTPVQRIIKKILNRMGIQELPDIKEKRRRKQKIQKAGSTAFIHIQGKGGLAHFPAIGKRDKTPHKEIFPTTKPKTPPMTGIRHGPGISDRLPDTIKGTRQGPERIRTTGTAWRRDGVKSGPHHWIPTMALFKGEAYPSARCDNPTHIWKPCYKAWTPREGENSLD